MSISNMFMRFLDNLTINNGEKISYRYGEITSSLNQYFRNTDATESNRLQVGSYGRWTAIRGISDLDMLYIMPDSLWNSYNKDGGQSKLLSDVRTAIKSKYPNSDIKVDQVVVTVTFNDFHIDIQPVFKLDDGSFKYPHTYNGGTWKITDPCKEISAMKNFVDNKNKNLRLLCKMIRSWKNKHGLAISGLLIDTLVYNFLNQTEYFDDKSFHYYDCMSRDFFEFMMNEPDKEYYLALGSKQRVYVKKKFQKVAKDAYELCLDAIKSADSNTAYDKWKKVYGRAFPSINQLTALVANESHPLTWKNTEEFIENKYTVDICYDLSIDCQVTQNGFRPFFLKAHSGRLSHKKSLYFFISETNVPEPYSVKWKVLNEGDEAKRRNNIRGQILEDDGYNSRNEVTSFRGNHSVECYLIKDNIVVARSKVVVPIE